MNDNENKKSRIYKIIICALFTAIICALSLVSIPLMTVPFTLSVFAVLLTGALLSPKYAAISVLCYILIGAIGIPVFSGFRGGLGVLFGVTGGYIISYPFMALAVAISVKLFKKRSLLSLSVGSITALIMCYVLGTLWFSRFTQQSFVNSLMVCVVPFVLFDLIKAALATFIALRLIKTPIGEKLI